MLGLKSAQNLHVRPAETRDGHQASSAACAAPPASVSCALPLWHRPNCIHAAQWQLRLALWLVASDDTRQLPSVCQILDQIAGTAPHRHADELSSTVALRRWLVANPLHRGRTVL